MKDGHLNFNVFLLRVELLDISDLPVMLETNLTGLLFCGSDS